MGDDSMRDQPGFFDIDDRLKRLSDLGDQLEAFRVGVDFETFRPELNAALSYSNGSQGGRPPFDPVMMFKILVIQAAKQGFRVRRVTEPDHGGEQARSLFQPQEKCGQRSYSGQLSLPSGVGNPGLSSPWP
jgi:hypothetical protein